MEFILRGNFFHPKTYYFSPSLGEKWYIFGRKKCYGIHFTSLPAWSDLRWLILHTDQTQVDHENTDMCCALDGIWTLNFRPIISSFFKMATSTVAQVIEIGGKLAR